MNLEITPEPTADERAAIAVALAHGPDTQVPLRDEPDDADCEENVKP
jgi:hypothetical protein